jgi:hypothetical protein
VKVEAPRRAVTMDEVRAHRDAIKRLGERFGVRNIRVFGSVARGEATPDSDLDLLGDAWRYWDRANVIARGLPDRYHHPWTMFGSSNVELHAVSISADLSKSQEARSHAEQIDPEDIPSTERRGRLGVEIAHSYSQRQDYPGILHWLEFAYQTSADSVQYSPSARQMASEAVDHDER